MELFTERLNLKDILPDKAKEIAKEYKLKEDNIEFIRKKNPLNAEDLKIEDGERAAIRYINTANLDRDNEIVLPSGGQVSDFKKSPTVLYAHNYHGLPVGKDIWLKMIQGKGWLAKTIYAKHQLAEDIYNLVKEKFLNTSSIGFIPLESVKPEDKDWDRVKEIVKSEYSINEKVIDKAKRIYTKWLLLEHSDVPIASNIEALNIAVGKGLKIVSQNLIDDLEIEIIDEEEEKDIITKPEETEDYIRIPVKGEEGKHSGHRIRTITISDEQGIKALYCGECKKAITFLFAKAKGWTMEKAKKWMAEHGKDIEDIETKELEIEEKSVIPFKETPKAPEGEAWDAGKEVREAEVSDLKIMCAWFDSENPDIKNSYKLPHHKAKGHAVVWRAVAAAMAALLGARGGVAIPASDRKGVYNHLVKHYKQFDKEPPEFKEYTQEELDEYFQDIPEEEQRKSFGLNEIYEIVKENKELKEKLEDIELKIGAVLNRKNKQNLKNAQNLIQEVLDSAEPAEEVEEGKDIEIEEDELDIEEGNGNKEEKENNSLDINEIRNIVKEHLRGYQEEVKKQNVELYSFISEKMPEVADIIYKKMKGKVL